MNKPTGCIVEQCVRRRIRRLLFVTAGVMLVTIFSVPAFAQQQIDAIELKPGFMNVPYSFDFLTLLSGGAAPFNFTSSVAKVTEPVQGLPPGLTLASNGQLGGTPTTPNAKPYTFDVVVTDANGAVFTFRVSLLINAISLDPNKVKAARLTQKTVDLPVPGVAVAVKPPFVLATSTADEETIALSEVFASAQPTPTNEYDTDNLTTLKQIVDASVGTDKNPANGAGFAADDYLALHLMVWKAGGEKTEPSRELWALYKAKDDPNNVNNVVWEAQIDSQNKHVFASRIYGAKRVVVLAVHLNTPESWDLKYKVTINQQVPTPVQNLLTLASAIAGATEAKKPGVKDIYGARMMLVRYQSSEMDVKLNTIRAGQTGEQVEQSKEFGKKYTNEGRYHWDVSVGVPLTEVKELQFESDGNKVTTAAKGRQSVYGFLNIYPKAVDLKGNDFLTPPHLVFGVPLATKPLHRPFVGLGTGVYKAQIKFNIFAGIVFNRELVPRTLQEGDVATPSQLESDLHPRWVRKFMFGINFPIGQIKNAIKQ